MTKQNHLTPTSLITGSPDLGTPEVKNRMNYAVPHLISSAMFSRRVGEIEARYAGQGLGSFWDEILAHATASVFVAVAGLEAYANELFVDMDLNFPEVRKELMEQLWSTFEEKKTLDKFDLALLLLKSPILVKGAEPVQGIDALIKLRNALMHFKPEWEPVEHAKLSAKLRTFFKPSEFFTADLGLFPQSWASHACTVWANNSVMKFIEHFEERAGLPHKLTTFLDRLQP